LQKLRGGGVYAVSPKVAIEAFKIVDNLSADMLGEMDERIKSVLGALKEISGVEEGVFVWGGAV